MIRIAGVCIFCFVFYFFPCQAQSGIEDSLRIKAYYCSQNADVTQKDFRFSLNPFVFTLGIYQLVVSEQLSSKCDYLPSCSRFAQGAIIRHGPLLGLLLTADRLSRCTGHAHLEYPAYRINNDKNAKVIDPPFYFILHDQNQ
ncbi:MAG: membrane protein insertion efficiency factor YidD [Bacteroidota bacterium]